MENDIETRRRIETLENYQRLFSEVNSTFSYEIENLFNQDNISFDTIRDISVRYLTQFSDEVRTQWFNELNNGVNILKTEAHLHQYNYSYGRMHQAKLRQCFEVIPNLSQIISNNEIEIIDYGCGQGIGTLVFIDYLESIARQSYSISRIRLIEPSELSLKRAALNVKFRLKSINQTENVLAINKLLDNINYQDIFTNQKAVKFHILSNIIDIQSVNVYHLCENINATQRGENYFICVSPKFWEDGINPRNIRQDLFMNYFNQKYNLSVISTRDSNIGSWKRYERVFNALM